MDKPHKKRQKVEGDAAALKAYTGTQSLAKFVLRSVLRQLLHAVLVDCHANFDGLPSKFQYQLDSDFTIAAGDRIFHVHKMILSSMGYFDNLFGGPWKVGPTWSSCAES